MSCGCKGVIGSPPAMAPDPAPAPYAGHSPVEGVVQAPVSRTVDDSAVPEGSFERHREHHHHHERSGPCRRCGQLPGACRCKLGADCECCTPAWSPPRISLVEPAPQNHCALPTNTGDSSFFIVNSTAFVIPGCGKEASFFTAAAKKLYAGAMLSLSPAGLILTILSTDPENNSVVVQNDCPDCNTYTPGQVVAPNSQWGVIAPSCVALTPSPDAPCSTFLGADFTTPAVGATAPLRITGSILGYALGDKISFQDKFFVIQAMAGLVWTVQNTGEGGTVGGTTFWDPDRDGTPSVCIEREGGNSPCQDTTNCGKIVVCKGDGTLAHIEGRIDKDILAWSRANECFEPFQLPGSLINCTALTACFTTDPDKDPSQTYLIEVEDSSIFADGLAIYNPLAVRIEGDKFWLTGIIDGTHVRVKPAFTVTTPKTYGGTCNSDALICEGDCCDQLQGCIPQVVVSDSIDGTFAGTVNPATRFSIDTLDTFSYVNDTPCTQLIQVAINLACAFDQEAGMLHYYSLKRDYGANDFLPGFSVITQDTLDSASPGADYPQAFLGLDVNNIYAGVLIDELLVPPGTTVNWQLLHKFVSPDSKANPDAYDYAMKWKGAFKRWRHA